jgi:hypothetical protein
MTQYRTWASYSGSAKTMLALVPLSLSRSVRFTNRFTDSMSLT